ncbi:MAG: biotin transporter BioY [Pseudomonadota bacterium]
MTRGEWIGALLCAAALAIAANLSFPLPGTSLPQTAQTIVVLLSGALLGFNGASITILLYLLAGIVGLSVFADGRSGAGVLFGPSGGYLLAFWFAAALIGYLADTGRLRRPRWRLLLWMLLAHALILLIGGGLLSVSVGITAAWFNGVQPFWVGALVKSVIAAVIVLLLELLPVAGGSKSSWQKQTTRQ